MYGQALLLKKSVKKVKLARKKAGIANQYFRLRTKANRKKLIDAERKRNKKKKHILDIVASVINMIFKDCLHIKKDINSFAKKTHKKMKRA